MTNTVSKPPSDPVPYILPGLTLEEKLEIFLYASEQYHEAIPKAKSDGVKRLLQHQLEFCAEFVDKVSEFITNGYRGDPGFDRLKEMENRLSIEFAGYQLIIRKYPKKDVLLVMGTFNKISEFTKNVANED